MRETNKKEILKNIILSSCVGGKKENVFFMCGIGQINLIQFISYFIPGEFLFSPGWNQTFEQKYWKQTNKFY